MSVAISSLLWQRDKCCEKCCTRGTMRKGHYIIQGKIIKRNLKLFHYKVRYEHPETHCEIILWGLCGRYNKYYSGLRKKENSKNRPAIPACSYCVLVCIDM